jgi:hypothetical protein
MKRERELQELKDRILALEMMNEEEDYQRQMHEDALLAQQLSSNPDMPASYKDAVLSGQDDDVRAKFAQEYSVSKPAASQAAPRASQSAASQAAPRASQPAAPQAAPRASQSAAPQAAPRASQSAASQAAPRASQSAASQAAPRASQPAVSQPVPQVFKPAASHAGLRIPPPLLPALWAEPRAADQSNSVVIVLIGKTENMSHKTYVLFSRDVNSQHFGLPNALGTHSQNDATKLLVRKTNHLLYVKPTSWKQYITGETIVSHLMVDEPSVKGFQYTRCVQLCREMGNRGLTSEWRENTLTLVDFHDLCRELLQSSGSFSTKDIEGQTITIDEMSCDFIRNHHLSYSSRDISMMPPMYFVPRWDPHREIVYASPQETVKFEKLGVYTIGH